MKQSTLFKGIKLGQLELKNRVVMAPMTRSFSENGIPGDNVVEYYARRASVGLIITEGTIVNHPGANGYPRVPHFYGEEALAAWKKVVESVHNKGGKIFPQLWHVGQVRKLGTEPDPTIPAYGPMEVVKDGEIVVRAMGQDDIDDVIQAFSQAAVDAKGIGFDGVEIHGAHGYLIDQFLFSGTNQRDDRYGGTLEKRCLFAKELITAIRERVGAEFPICFRFSQWKIADYKGTLANSPEELKQILDILVEAGVDIFHCSNRRFWEPEFAGSNMNLAGWTKKITGKPCITVGSVGLDQDFLTTFDPKSEDSEVTSLEKLEGPLERGEFDLVAVGRGLISNPDWVEKVEQGRVKELKPYSKEDLKSLY